MTSAHSADDPRIFAKECRTLAALGYDVHLIAPSAPNTDRDGVRLWGIPPSSSRRALRMTRTVAQVHRVARALDADLYHLHDPELIPAGLLLSSTGKRVIYDAHEDLRASILSKHWVNRRLRVPLSRVVAVLEQAAVKRLAAVVAATPSIQQRFVGSPCHVMSVSNFPELAEFDSGSSQAPAKERAVCYVGGISESRGARVMVEAIAQIDATLLLAGWYSPEDLRDTLATVPGWSSVVDLGQLERPELVRMLSRCRAGLVVLAPTPSYVTSQPTKLYEYMAAGLPVIASDFPAWQAIVDKSRCGICVDPMDPGAVARAIRWILDHPHAADEMGRNGRATVERDYTWQAEARKLASLYETLLSEDGGHKRRRGPPASPEHGHGGQAPRTPPERLSRATPSANPSEGIAPTDGPSLARTGQTPGQPAGRSPPPRTYAGSVSMSRQPIPAADQDEARLAASRPQSIAAGGLEALVFRGIVLVCFVLLVIVTSRLMGPTGRGLYALASLAGGLCGLPFGAVWIANAVEVARRRVSLSELFGGSIVLAIAGGLATALAALAVAPLLGDQWWVVALPAAVTPFMLLSRYEEGLYTSIGHVRAVNHMRLARAVLPLVFIAAPLLAGASPRTAIAIWVLWWAALATIAFFPARSMFGRPKLPRQHGFYRRVMGYGAKMAGLNAVTMFNDRVGLLALAILATDADVGIYSVAIAGTSALLLAAEALPLSAFRRIGSSSREESAALTLRAMRHSILIAAAGSVVLVPVAFLAVPWTVGAGYEDVPLLFVLLIPSTICGSAFLPLYIFFEVQVATAAVRLKIAGSALLANVVLCFALGAVWGRWGVALGTSLAFLLAAAVAFSCFRAETGAKPRQLRPGRREVQDYVALAGSFMERWRQAS